MAAHAPEAAGLEIVALSPSEYEASIVELGALLTDAVEGGASVNFLAGVTDEQARAWWAERVPKVRDGTITAFVAHGGGTILGTTLLIRSRNQNSPHRAEIAKVIVRRSGRRRGIGRALMTAAEETAKREGRWLLILDTEAGTAADALYRALGWQILGTMPNHALRSDGVLAPTTYFWKDLREG